MHLEHFGTKCQSKPSSYANNLWPVLEGKTAGAQPEPARIRPARRHATSNYCNVEADTRKRPIANCKTIEQRLAVEEELNDVRRDRLENKARALASAILMPEATVRPFVEGLIQKFTDEHGHVLVGELASAISHEYDVNFKPARRRLKLLGYHRSHGWELD